MIPNLTGGIITKKGILGLSRVPARNGKEGLLSRSAVSRRSGSKGVKGNCQKVKLN